MIFPVTGVPKFHNMSSGRSFLPTMLATWWPLSTWNIIFYISVNLLRTPIIQIINHIYRCTLIFLVFSLFQFLKLQVWSFSNLFDEFCISTMLLLIVVFFFVIFLIASFFSITVAISSLDCLKILRIIIF